MASNADVRPDRRSPRSSCRTTRTTLAAGAAVLAVTGAIASAAPASAEAFSVPGLPGLTVDVPLPPGFFGIPGFLPLPSPPEEAEKSLGERALDVALTKLGAPYHMGATGPDSFDCSGLVQWSYRQVGGEVPRTSYEQLAAGTPAGRDELRPGDVVAFYGGSHSALYAGDGKVVHAATPGTGVQLAPISSMPYSGARRF